jgi:hypothetical protein
MSPEFEVNTELESKESSYEEYVVPCFSVAVNEALRLSSLEKDDTHRIALVDIDGSLIEDDRVKIPFFSHRFEPSITNENKVSLIKLIAGFEGCVSIITNRGTRDNFLWNTGRVFSKVKDFLNTNETNVEIYRSLLRQFPFLKMGDTERLIKHLGERVLKSENKTLNVYGIEDWSFVSPNRKSFYTYISKEVLSRYGGVLRVRNFVIKG